MLVNIPVWLINLVVLSVGTGVVYVLAESLLSDYVNKKLEHNNDQIKRLWLAIDDFYDLKDEIEDIPYLVKADLEKSIRELKQEV